MSDRTSLETQLRRARRVRDILLEQKAGYGLRVPVEIEIALEEKEDEVRRLEAELGLGSTDYSRLSLFHAISDGGWGRRSRRF